MPYFRILFIGDIIGSTGRSAIREILPEINEQYHPNFIIANGENLAGGNGLTKETADEMLSYGVNLLTTGNHVWDKKEILEFIDSYDKILRPANYPDGVPGKGYVGIEVPNEQIGRVAMRDVIESEAVSGEFDVMSNVARLQL